MPAFPLNDGSFWSPDEDRVAKWVTLYPAVNVPQELNAMVGWLDANPTKRKTPKGIARFCNNWLARAQNSGGQSPFAPKRQEGDAIKTRDMSYLDDLTHNFTNCPNMRERFLRDFGQVFENGKRTVR